MYCIHQWRHQGGREGSFPPYGWTSKNYVICVCFHCHGTSSYHTTNTLQGRRAKSHIDTQTIQPGLGDFVLKTPYIDPYLTSPRYKILAAPLVYIMKVFHSQKTTVSEQHDPDVSPMTGSLTKAQKAFICQ